MFALGLLKLDVRAANSFAFIGTRSGHADSFADPRTTLGMRQHLFRVGALTAIQGTSDLHSVGLRGEQRNERLDIENLFRTADKSTPSRRKGKVLAKTILLTHFVRRASDGQLAISNCSARCTLPTSGNSNLSACPRTEITASA